MAHNKCGGPLRPPKIEQPLYYDTPFHVIDCARLGDGGKSIVAIITLIQKILKKRSVNSQYILQLLID